MCSARCVALERAGQEEEPCETLKVTIAGLAPSDVIEVAVKPTGSPVSDFVVITATPEAWRRKAVFKDSEGSWFRSLSIIAYKISPASTNS
jgi:hypothetical protein